jgi:hypothetical protein
LLAAVGRPATAPGITAATGRRHEWYPPTEGPVIDLELLPPAGGSPTDSAGSR